MSRKPRPGAPRGAQRQDHGRRPTDTAAPRRPAPEVRAAAGEVWIYGMHPSLAALRNPARKILRVVATADVLQQLRGEADLDVPALAHATPADRAQIDALLGPNAVHQGIAVLARTLAPHLADVLAQHAQAPRVCVVVLDQVTDPHNVGAILRSAAAFGATAVIAPDRGAPEETGTMAKSASGALERVPYIKGGNLVRQLEELKDAGFWLVGLETDGDRTLADVNLTGRIALVLGAEGEGLRRLVRETCDFRARLPMPGKMESLNVSNAAAVALYEWVRQSAAG